ncbi:MAG: hypothetical protein ACJ754_20795 [Pyrinomonadaceae bacterium]
MKKIILEVLLLRTSGLFAQQQDYPIQTVNFTKVHVTDNFWLPRMKTNHTVTIPASFARCESTGRVKNFDMAAAKSGKFCTIFHKDDMRRLYGDDFDRFREVCAQQDPGRKLANVFTRRLFWD